MSIRVGWSAIDPERGDKYSEALPHSRGRRLHNVIKLAG